VDYKMVKRNLEVKRRGDYTSKWMNFHFELK